MSEARNRLMDRIDELRGYDEDYDEHADLIVSLEFPESEPRIAYREVDEHLAAMPAVPPGHRIVVLNWD